VCLYTCAFIEFLSNLPIRIWQNLKIAYLCPPFISQLFLVNALVSDCFKTNWQNSKLSSVMKKEIHPKNYRLVVFKDFSCDEAFLTRSCAPTKDTITWEDGKEYPLIKLEISSASHPFFTGKMKFVDTAGRIDKFNKKFASSKFAKADIE
jgi:large subunit ribosomal protein L31